MLPGDAGFAGGVGGEDGTDPSTGDDEGRVVAFEVVAADGVSEGTGRTAVGQKEGETDAGGPEGIEVIATGAADVGGAVPGVVDGVAACNAQTGAFGSDSVTVPEMVGGTSLTASWTTCPWTTTVRPLWIVPPSSQLPQIPTRFPSASTSALVVSSRRYPRLYKFDVALSEAGGRRISKGVLMHSVTSIRQWTECSVGPSRVTIEGLSNRKPWAMQKKSMAMPSAQTASPTALWADTEENRL